MDHICNAAIGLGTLIHTSKTQSQSNTHPNNSITVLLGGLIPTTDVVVVQQSVELQVGLLRGYKDSNTTQYRCLLDLQQLIR